MLAVMLSDAASDANAGSKLVSAIGKATCSVLTSAAWADPSDSEPARTQSCKARTLRKPAMDAMTLSLCLGGTRGRDACRRWYMRNVSCRRAPGEATVAGRREVAGRRATRGCNRTQELFPGQATTTFCCHKRALARFLASLQGRERATCVNVIRALHRQRRLVARMTYDGPGCEAARVAAAPEFDRPASVLRVALGQIAVDAKARPRPVDVDESNCQVSGPLEI